MEDVRPYRSRDEQNDRERKEAEQRIDFEFAPGNEDDDVPFYVPRD